MQSCCYRRHDVVWSVCATVKFVSICVITIRPIPLNNYCVSNFIIPAKAFARDYVITGVGLSVCLFVCLFVTTITK